MWVYCRLELLGLYGFLGGDCVWIKGEVVRPGGIAPCFTRTKNNEIFYLPHMIKFAHSKFILAIKGPKLTRKQEEMQNLYTTQNRGNFLHLFFDGAIHGSILPDQVCKGLH